MPPAAYNAPLSGMNSLDRAGAVNPGAFRGDPVAGLQVDCDLEPNHMFRHALCVFPYRRTSSSRTSSPLGL